MVENCRDVVLFSKLDGIRLREYQVKVVTSIARSVIRGEGLSYVVMFPRQSGKNELQAHLEAYLMTLLSETGGEIVKISPTWKPQSQNAMRRLEKVLKSNPLTNCLWKKEQGYIYSFGAARVIFLSGSPETNIVGATASTLLEIDEAQDVLIEKYDRDIAPMAASTNATRIFWGTAWTSDTLLARELRMSRLAEQQDSQQRVFRLTADDVSAEVLSYKKFVSGQVQRFGRAHPAVKSQFYSEEVDAESGMFPPARLALMQGSHPRRCQPEPGKVYAFLLDVAGEDENTPASPAALGRTASLAEPGRDATALTIVEVDTESISDRLIRRPVYRVVNRCLWVGVRHTTLYDQILALAEAWRVWRVVVDGTGVGAGLASFLAQALPGRLETFIFTAASKGQLGWAFMGLVECGRFKDWHRSTGARGDEGGWQEEFYQQVGACQMEVLPGPERRLRWGVPDGRRDERTGELLHDDLVISAALASVLDKAGWPARGKGTVIIPAKDPLRHMDFGY